MAATYTLAGNGNSAQLKENPDGTVSITNAGKTGTFKKSEVANYLTAQKAANPSANIKQEAVPNVSVPEITGNISGGSSSTSGTPNNSSPTGNNAPAVGEGGFVPMGSGVSGQTTKIENGVAKTYDLATGKEVTSESASNNVVAAQAAQNNAIAGVQGDQSKPATASPEDVKRAETVAAAEKSSLETSEKASQKSDEDNRKLLEDRVKRDKELATQLSDIESQKINDEKVAAKAKLDADTASAMAQTAVQESISALAMNRLGLTHSGSAVATFQSIATQGFQKLAQINAEFTLKNSALAHEANKNRLNLQKDLYKIIDDGNDKIVELNTNTAKRIGEYQKNIVLSDAKKEESIKKLVAEAKEEKRKQEDRTIALAEARTSIAEKQAEYLRIQDNRAKEKAASDIQSLVDTGKWISMTPEERAEYEKKAGVPLGSTYGKVGSQAAQDFRKLVDSLGVKGYFPSLSQTDSFTKDVVSYMKLGDSREEAVNKAFSSYVSGDAKLQALLKKAASSGSSSSGKLKPLGTPYAASEGVVQNFYDDAGNVYVNPVSADPVAHAQLLKKAVKAGYIREPGNKLTAGEGGQRLVVDDKGNVVSRLGQVSAPRKEDDVPGYDQ